jgi:hypothetical protein
MVYTSKVKNLELANTDSNTRPTLQFKHLETKEKLLDLS